MSTYNGNETQNKTIKTSETCWFLLYVKGSKRKLSSQILVATIVFFFFKIKKQAYSFYIKQHLSCHDSSFNQQVYSFKSVLSITFVYCLNLFTDFFGGEKKKIKSNYHKRKKVTIMISQTFPFSYSYGQVVVCHALFVS